ncbi:hypothetical protein Kpol_178p3 [Vanderwaltozyma polyspora DSM 70294]|uniref:Uncharacterized protein n=1 Tax=Vanderwaltozyma polyspora (strain ATCC 22028 / DSM 70294 / BCRC 21397 / CBS 2163 / NBRC 10782 / NRRL Y-8283 / UCD 57-17) TaxID=436907 RepID=A7TTN9_VANPO|nr:uncharacterized protein Kpol_178p3 [Vanderwaltozyma polyspora DSM 70294]EDO14369.1 hypothetical protein Kpol_178p3 [Vanderwaltozyma polyspora DSM 70294]
MMNSRMNDRKQMNSDDGSHFLKLKFKGNNNNSRNNSRNNNNNNNNNGSISRNSNNPVIQNHGSQRLFESNNEDLSIVFHKFNKSKDTTFKNTSAKSYTQKMYPPSIRFVNQKELTHHIKTNNKNKIHHRINNMNNNLIIKTNPKYNKNNIHIIKSTKMLDNEIGKRPITFVSAPINGSPSILLSERCKDTNLVEHFLKTTNNIEKVSIKDDLIDIQKEFSMLTNDPEQLKNINDVFNNELKLQTNKGVNSHKGNISSKTSNKVKGKISSLDSNGNGKFSSDIRVKLKKTTAEQNLSNYSTCTFRVKMKDNHQSNT